MKRAHKRGWMIGACGVTLALVSWGAACDRARPEARASAPHVAQTLPGPD